MCGIILKSCICIGKCAVLGLWKQCAIVWNASSRLGFHVYPPSSNAVQCRPIVLVPTLCAAVYLCNATLLCANTAFIPQIRLPLETISLLRSVDGVTDVCTRKRETEEHELDEEPCPAATTALLPNHGRARLFAARAVQLRGVCASVLLVQVLRFDGDDIVVVGQFAGLSRKP